MINICLEYVRVSLEYNVKVNEEALIAILTLIIKEKKHLTLHFLL